MEEGCRGENKIAAPKLCQDPEIVKWSCHVEFPENSFSLKNIEGPMLDHCDKASITIK